MDKVITRFERVEDNIPIVFPEAIDGIRTVKVPSMVLDGIAKAGLKQLREFSVNKHRRLY